MKKGPLFQLMELKLPELTVPAPISKLTRPLLFDIGVWVSEYITFPLTDPWTILICMPIFWLVNKASEASLDTVVTSKGITSKNVAQKFGFNTSSSAAKDILENKSINTVFIATPHNSHAKYVIEALKNDKNVFVEKPLAMNEEELEQVETAYKESQNHLLVGFNRRFADVSKTIKASFEGQTEPVFVNIRVNAGFIPKEHWTQNPEIGGGRIIGEMCHFIDLMQYFTNSEPVKVYAECINTANEKTKADDNISIVVKFRNGSVGNLI